MAECNLPDRSPVTTRRGFSMIEVIAMLFLVGILAAGAMSFMDTGRVDRVGEAQTLRNAIRFTQVMALSDNVVWNLQINVTGYELQRNCVSQPANSRRVNLPSRDSAEYETPNGLNVFSNVNVVFNSRGQPSDCQGAALNADVVVDIKDGGEPSESLRDITITRNTGFLQ